MNSPYGEHAFWRDVIQEAFPGQANTVQAWCQCHYSKLLPKHPGSTQTQKIKNLIKNIRETALEQEDDFPQTPCFWTPEAQPQTTTQKPLCSSTVHVQMDPVTLQGSCKRLGLKDQEYFNWMTSTDVRFILQWCTYEQRKREKLLPIVL